MAHGSTGPRNQLRTLTRRLFLKGTLGTGTVLLLAACGPSTSTTSAPTSGPNAAAPTKAAAAATSAGAPSTPPAAPTAASGATSAAAATPRPAATPSAATPGTVATAGASTGTAVLKGTKLHLLSWSSFVPAEDQWFKETLVNEWATPNGVELTIELVSANDVQPKVTAALQSGAGPDLLQMQWTWPHLYADKLVDVSDIADKAGSDGGGWFEAPKQNCYVNGKWLAMPFALTGNAIAYRSSWMKEGAGTDQFPTTWEDYTKVGGAVKQKKNTFVGQAVAHSFGDPPTFIFPFLWSFGGSETDETGKKIAINSPETEAALKAFKEWFDACSDPQCLSWDDSSNNRAYLAGQIWATLNGASIYVKALTDAPDIAQDTQHALLPKGPKGQFILAFPYGFAIPTYVKDPKPAKALLAHLLDPKVYGGFMKAGKGYTQAPYKKGATELWPSTDPKFDPFKQIGDLSKWYGYPAPPSPAAAQSGSKYIVVDMFAKVIQGETPQAAMQWAEGELKNVYQV